MCCPPMDHFCVDWCHTPFRESGNEASIRVPGMFKSHVQQQYDKHVWYSIIQSHYFLHNDPWVWKNLHQCSGKTTRRMSLHRPCTEVSPLVWASHPPRSPLLCLMGSSHHSFTHTIPQFCHRSFTEHPTGLPSQLPHTASWYAKTSLHHILCQAIPI
jgi:hypothetical protein